MFKSHNNFQVTENEGISKMGQKGQNHLKFNLNNNFIEHGIT